MYTLPVIHDPNTGATVSDSVVIAEYLEKTYPNTPKVFPNETHGLQLAYLKTPLLAPATAIVLPQTHKILNPPSEVFFRATREKTFGRQMEDVPPRGEERVATWKQVEDNFAKVAQLYEKEGGPFMMGRTLSYADIVTGSMLVWVKLIFGEDSEEWKLIKGWQSGRWETLLKDMEKYLTVV